MYNIYNIFIFCMIIPICRFYSSDGLNWKFISGLISRIFRCVRNREMFTEHCNEKIMPAIELGCVYSFFYQSLIYLIHVITSIRFIHKRLIFSSSIICTSMFAMEPKLSALLFVSKYDYYAFGAHSFYPIISLWFDLSADNFTNTAKNICKEIYVSIYTKSTHILI